MLPLIIVRPGVLEAVSAHTCGGGDFRVQLCLHAAWSCRRWQKGAFPGSAISRRHLGPPRSPGITLRSGRRETMMCILTAGGQSSR